MGAKNGEQEQAWDNKLRSFHLESRFRRSGEGWRIDVIFCEVNYELQGLSVLGATR